MKIHPDFLWTLDGLSIDTKSFIESLSIPYQTTIRRHAIKSDAAYYTEFSTVPWCDHSYVLPERPHFNKEPSFLTGEYYVQESSSMFLYHILQQLDLPNSPAVLDACAAPGGKSTILLDHLQGEGTLIANEVIRSRAKVLSENLVKWGYNNYIITNSDISKFSQVELFDLVLIDAPCSGEGLIRRDPNAMDHWSLEHVKHCAARQKRILNDTIDLIKPGGYLVYSTCTYNAQENEEQIQSLIQHHKFDYQYINYPTEWNILQNELGLRFFPHLIDGEGLFMAVLKKKGNCKELRLVRDQNQNNLPQKSLKHLYTWTGYQDPGYFSTYQEGIVLYSGHLSLDQFKKQRIYSFGRHMGKLIRDKLRPHPHFAFSIEFNPNLQRKELSKSVMIKLMDRNLVNSLGESGWTLLTYRDNGLFWAKPVNNKYKVQYPKF